MIGKNVFVFFAGTGAMSMSFEHLLRQMVYYVENLLGLKEHFEVVSLSGFGIEVVDGVTTIYGRCLTHGSTEAIQNSQYIGLKSGQTTYCAGTICYRIAT